MKRMILLMCLALNMCIGYAQNYTGSQETLRSQISAYLSRQGFKPENQSDGLRFKSEGVYYYVEIDKDEEKPMYVRLRRYVKFDNKLTREKVLKNLNSYNVKFGAKVSCQEKNIVISVEMFLTKASQFTYVFDSLLSQVKSAYDKVNE